MIVCILARKNGQFYAPKHKKGATPFAMDAEKFHPTNILDRTRLSTLQKNGYELVTVKV